MEFNLLYIVSLIVVIMIFWFLSSMLVREVAELFKQHQNTFHKSNQVASVLTFVMFLQFLFSSLKYGSIIFLIIFIIALFYMIYHAYKPSLSKAMLIGITVLIGYIIIFMLLAAVLLMFSSQNIAA